MNQRIIYLSTLLLAACGDPGSGFEAAQHDPSVSPNAEYEAQISVKRQGIVDGDRPSNEFHNGGVARLWMWNSSTSTWKGPCSSQVIASDTVVTSAHCLPATGNVTIGVWRQKPDNSWDCLLSNPPACTATATLRMDDYDGFGDAKDDIATVQLTSGSFEHISWSDAAYLLADSSTLAGDNDVYGYSDGSLRHADVSTNYTSNVYWAQLSSGTGYICPGDSGGPLKSSISTSRDGILLGATALSVVDQNGNCIPGIASWTPVKRNLNFVLGAFGSGRCSSTTVDGYSVRSCW